MKNGFTLAEVLITLGIIGIVAAITLPIIIQNYKKYIVETRLKKFYATMTTAIVKAESKHGESANWDTLTHGGSTPWFEKYLISEFEIIEKIDIPIERINAESKMLPGDTFYILKDGSGFVFNGNGITYFINAKDFYNCTFKTCYGTKFFGFEYKQNGSYAYRFISKGAKELAHLNSNSLEHALKYGNGGGCGGCYYENETKPACYCTYIIQRNGWKIPKDYPLKF